MRTYRASRSTMSYLHICNTFFEKELESARECKAALPLKNWLSSHPATLQLQYLPLLYAQPEDLILVADLPPNPDPRLWPIDRPIPQREILSWGASEAIAQFAKQKNLIYNAPPFSLVRQIQSKEFTFRHRPLLTGSALLYTSQEVHAWIEKTPGKKVLKQVLGFAGQGHFFVDSGKDLASFLAKEFTKQQPVLAEPWLSRTFDFSSQWEISAAAIRLEGLTTFETSAKGVYSATLAGPLDQLFSTNRWAVEQHLEVAYPILQTIQKLGFFGSIGVDAFIYDENKLNPIVEINARKTMSRIALQIQQQQFPNAIARMSFEAKPGGILPGSFARNVFIELKK